MAHNFLNQKKTIESTLGQFARSKVVDCFVKYLFEIMYFLIFKMTLYIVEHRFIGFVCSVTSLISLAEITLMVVEFIFDKILRTFFEKSDNRLSQKNRIVFF